MQAALQDQLMRRLRESFRLEFLNRIDEIIVFRQFGRDQLRQVTGLLLEETRRKLHAQDITVEFAPEAIDWIAEHGYQPEFGARPMRRTIQREVGNRLSRLLLDGQIEPGQRLVIGVAGGRLTFETSAGDPPPAAPLRAALALATHPPATRLSVTPRTRPARAAASGAAAARTTR